MIKKGDNVIVIAGSEKGKKGKITKVDRDSGRVFIDGLNMKKKSQRATRNSKGQVLNIAHSMHISNVMLLEGSKRVRLGSKMVGKKRVRVSKKSGNEI